MTLTKMQTIALLVVNLALILILALFTAIDGAQSTAMNSRYNKFKIVKKTESRMIQLDAKAVTASTVSECAIKCTNFSKECFSFVYDGETNSCHYGSWAVASGEINEQNCEKYRNPSSQVLDSIPGKLYTYKCCPTNYQFRMMTKTQFKCIRFLGLDDGETFMAARDECFNDSARLITFKTLEEMHYVKWLLDCGVNTWVGVRDNCADDGITCIDDASRTFYWVDKEKLSGEVMRHIDDVSDFNKGKESCINIGKDHKNFNDEICGKTFAYVCEKDGMKEDLYCA